MNSTNATRRRNAFAAHDLLVWLLLIIVCGAVIVFAVLLEQRRSETPAAKVATSRDIPTGTDRVVESFTLTDQNGSEFSTDSLKGKYWIADFIFTNCAGPCPIMTAEMRKLQEQYGSKDDLRFVSISVDPGRDTPERLREYASNYNADLSTWTFLTGSYDKIQHLAGNVFLLALANPAGASGQQGESAETGTTEEPGAQHEVAHTGPIVHSTRFVLVGPDQRIVSWYTGTDPESVAHLRQTLDAIFDQGNEG